MALMGWSRDQTQTPPRAGLFNLWEGRRPYKVRYAPEPPPYRHSWQTEALASEVRGILDAIDAPPADSEVVLQFQKTLYRRKYCDYDARGQIILTCRCILESKGNEGAFSEPFVSAVHGVCNNKEFADRGLELVEAFDQIQLVEIWRQCDGLEYFRKCASALGQIVRNKVRRILFPP